jgi:hypothetical protein
MTCDIPAQNHRKSGKQAVMTLKKTRRLPIFNTRMPANGAAAYLEV